MRISCLVWLAAVGCTVELDGSIGAPASIAFSSPAPGSSHTRDALGTHGALIAAVPLVLDVAGEPARVVIESDGQELGDATSGELLAELRTKGQKSLTATAFDADGAVLATATLDISVVEPEVGSCQDWLDLYQLDYTTGPANQGVADPITVKTPINGVGYRYNGSTEPRKTLFGDCALIKSLAEGASIMREHGISTLVDIGVYNYRCIDQSKTPPNCTMSQHAYAKAIDIAGFETGGGASFGGAYHSVLTDWVIDPADDTCTATTEGDKDTFLHQVICRLKAADVWNIVLTPNYNSAHRNHFHVDLTAGADTIKRLSPELLLDYRAFSAAHAD